MYSLAHEITASGNTTVAAGTQQAAMLPSDEEKGLSRAITIGFSVGLVCYVLVIA